ncbi:MAG: hypothetical protein JXA33_16835 [Anaerolineae bacterium]|nr:hypothetical protein [Anaerolineae bacterium]
MPGFLFHNGGVAQCPHAAPLTFTPSNTRVLVNMMSVATAADVFTISGCPFQIPIGTGTKPQPCVVATLAPAAKVLVNNSPAILNVGSSVCRSAEQIPQGPAAITSTQTKVVAT